MSIVKLKDKRTGTTYVYESESYWDKEKKQPRNKRILIGKIDEETGGIVPTDGRGRKRKQEAEKAAGEEKNLLADIKRQLKEKELEVKQLTAEIGQLKRDLSAVLESLHKITDRYDGKP